MKKALALCSLLAASAVAPAAQAQCPPGSWLCADISIGASVQMAPPPVVVVQPMPPPPPPVVYVQPPPPPRVVYVQPPPVVVYRPAPPPVYVMQPQMQYYPSSQRSTLVGLQAQLGASYLGGVTGESAMYSGGLGLRLRGRNAWWGAELALNGALGTDYNNDSRVEIPFSTTALVYFNPQHRVQVYGLLGASLSFAFVDYRAGNRAAHGGLLSGEYAHFGGHTGLGIEAQLSPHVSFFADVRGFLRTRIDDAAGYNPEFSRTVGGATQSTNTSMGVVSQLGLTFYL